MDKDSEERVCRCALNRIFGFEPAMGRALLEAVPSAKDIFGMGTAALTEVMGPYSRFRDAVASVSIEKERAELEKLQDSGCCFITTLDEEYPEILRQCEDAPTGLYVKGSADLQATLRANPPVAVVGTRDFTLYGKEWCSRLVTGMASALHRPTIVSGLAIGVDVTAHLAALDSGLPTIAVLPTGIDAVYPVRHRSVAERIASTPGCALVTDYPPHTQPKAVNFIRRNRIIAGLSGSTLLVESKATGGGMLTARLAFSYGREVLALPGRIDDPRSAGCNALIREHVAEAVTDIAGLVEAAGLGGYVRTRSADLVDAVRALYSQVLPDTETEALASVASAVRRTRGIDPDGICSALGMGYGEVMAHLSRLECDGFISMDLLQRCTLNGKFV